MCNIPVVLAVKKELSDQRFIGNSIDANKINRNLMYDCSDWFSIKTMIRILGIKHDRIF